MFLKSSGSPADRRKSDAETFGDLALILAFQQELQNLDPGADFIYFSQTQEIVNKFFRDVPLGRGFKQLHQLPLIFKINALFHRTSTL